MRAEREPPHCSRQGADVRATPRAACLPQWFVWRADWRAERENIGVDPTTRLQNRGLQVQVLSPLFLRARRGPAAMRGVSRLVERKPARADVFAWLKTGKD